jgi:hypothetical protein
VQDGDDPALWKNRHEDGELEDLDATELASAVEAHESQRLAPMHGMYANDDGSVEQADESDDDEVAERVRARRAMDEAKASADEHSESSSDYDDGKPHSSAESSRAVAKASNAPRTPADIQVHFSLHLPAAGGRPDAEAAQHDPVYQQIIHVVWARVNEADKWWPGCVSEPENDEER